MAHSSDRPGDVRPGEELDVAALAAYLKAHVPELDAPFEVLQFPGGHSNLTYMLRFADRDAVLRRPPLGLEIATAHDMGREYGILSHLWGHYDRIPRPYAFCEDKAVLGAPFYLMSRVDGVILRSKTPPAGITLDADAMGKASAAVADNLAAIHGVDLDATGLRDFGKPAGYVRRQVDGWTKRYAAAKTDHINAMERLPAWLYEHMPAEIDGTLIHNDYKYDNIVLDRDDLRRIVAVLDWEMATVGDPLMDLGTALSLWVDPDDPDLIQLLPFGPTMLPGSLDRLGFAERYTRTAGRPAFDPVYYFAFGAYKMAVVLQQIYKRYKLGHSKDERFANFIIGVAAFAQMADLAIERGRIDRLG